MFGLRKIGRDEVVHLEEAEALLRVRFGLGEDALVLVTEEAGQLPGHPPRMTTMLFWTPDGRRHRFRVFKPARALVPDDLPPRWLRAALVDDGDAECC